MAGENQNKVIRNSMDYAIDYGIKNAKQGSKFSKNYCTKLYEEGVETGDIDIFYEDFLKMARLAYDIFINNGGEF